jgi:hypothetical protein
MWALLESCREININNIKLLTIGADLHCRYRQKSLSYPAISAKIAEYDKLVLSKRNSEALNDYAPRHICPGKNQFNSHLDGTAFMPGLASHPLQMDQGWGHGHQ